MEVRGDPGDTDVVLLWVRAGPGVRREEDESLQEPHSEEHDLVPGQGLSHALPLTHSKRDQGGVLLVPFTSWKWNKEVITNTFTSRPR